MSQPNLQRRYQRIAAKLTEEIQAGRFPDGQLPSERDLARRFRVNPRTLREALWLLVEAGLITRQQGRGTFIRETQPTRRVAILTNLDFLQPHASEFFLHLMHQLHAVLHQSGYPAEYYIGHRPLALPQNEMTCQPFLEDLAAGKLSGVVAVATRPAESWMRLLAERAIPVVGTSELYAYSVGTDQAELVRTGVRLLLAQGRRRIALLGWYDPRQAVDGAPPSLRQIFRDELARAGVALQEAWLRDAVHPSQPAAGWEELREIWSARVEKPDGLLITDDLLYRDALPALLQLGVRIPDELMVVTHANRDSGAIYPFAVTRLECDPAQYAAQLGRLLVRLMRREAVEPQRVIVPFTCVSAPGLPVTMAVANQ